MEKPELAEFQIAVQMHSAGRLDEAQRIYRRILDRDPNHVDVAHMLAVLLSQRGDLAAAEPLFRRVLAASPDALEANLNFAIHCQNAGRFDEAVTALSKVLRLKPDYVDAEVQLGSIHRHLGRHADAIRHFTRAIQLQPGCAAAHIGLCAMLGEAGQLDQAILCGQSATLLDPANPEAHLNLGTALGLMGHLAESLAALERAIQLQPTSSKAMLNMAWVLDRTGDAQRAADLCRRALAIEPNSPKILDQLSYELHSLGRIDEAIEAAAKAVQIDPGHGAWNNLGASQLTVGEFKAAITSYRRALEIQPLNQQAHSNLLMAMNCDPDITAAEAFEAHRNFQTQQVTARKIPTLSPANSRQPDRPLRVAYVSPDLRRHPVTAFVEPLIRAHDRNSFIVSCYSDVRKPDATTQRLKGYVTTWHDTAELGDEELARLIHTNREDILIDLSGHAAHSRLLAFAAKPAPIQISYLGYLKTTGIDAMDYRLTDSIADPPGQSDPFYTEQLLRLPCFFCYEPPAEAPDVGPLPSIKAGAITFGSLNHSAKFNPGVLELWARLLQQVPASRLMLTANAPGSAERRLLDFFTTRGIEPNRIELIQRQGFADYLACYNRIDIALDPFPFNGHTTTCDALWMGVPVVGLLGGSYASRTCASVLTHLGLPQLIAGDSEQYLTIVKTLAGDPSELSRLRETLRDRMLKSVITDSRAFIASLESAYRDVWRRWCAT